VRLNLKAATADRDVDGMNIVGEIPGGAKKDEVVMIGAHFDSWHSGTGATDNGAGSAVMIEAMRILKSLGLKLDRTVRIGLWSGEEEGLFGSRAYVKEHFADPGTMRVTAEHAKLSVYFNLDNGSGKIRGVYLQGNGAVRPIFEAWLAPFRDLGVTTVSIPPSTGPSPDDAVGGVVRRVRVVRHHHDGLAELLVQARPRIWCALPARRRHPGCRWARRRESAPGR
jgi:carboxypeptidase Q